MELNKVKEYVAEGELNKDKLKEIGVYFDKPKYWPTSTTSNLQWGDFDGINFKKDLCVEKNFFVEGNFSTGCIDGCYQILLDDAAYMTTGEGLIVLGSPENYSSNQVYNAIGSLTLVYSKAETDEKLSTKADTTTASTTADGLMSKDDKVKLEDLNSFNYIGILSNWKDVAKLTTESTEADILNALAITPLRGNKINTKTELFKVLDQCAINKKFLKESSTNAHVFVEHIGSCYVIQILGNKAAVLNGKLVGTPVLRHITISANSNEALTVRKNPFEIKLEDINKKVANLETQIKDLTDRITAF